MRVAIVGMALCAALAAQTEIDVRSGVFRGRPVTYRVIGGLAILDGDIILGKADEMEAVGATKADASRDALLTPDTRFRWTNATIPYRIDADIPNPQRILDAVAHWNANTPIQLTPWAGEANRLRFVREQNFGICFSSVGMIGGEQNIRVDDLCAAGGLIHEIGHTVGLYHEQSRVDRDRYVYVAFDNINKALVGNFNQNFGAAEVAPYDYASIMGYSRFSDARNVFAPTIETIPPGILIGQYNVLSPEEILVVKQMYGQAPKSTLISSNPTGLTVLVDGVPITTPQTFDWPLGDSHTVEAPGPQGDATQQFVFGRWSDEGDRAHTITVGAGLSVYAANFVQMLPLKTSVVGNGTVTVTPRSDSGFYPTGSILTVTAIPADGYSFRSWTGFINVLHGAGSNPATLRLGFTGANYVANFIPRAPATVTTDPPGLRLTVDGASSASPRGFDWAEGSTHTIAVQSPIAPQAGVRYIFQKWSDGGDLSHGVTAQSPPATYTAIFTTQYQLTTNTAGVGGSITVSPPSTDGFYDAGTTVRVTASPANGFSFANWSGDVTSSEVSRTIIMDDQQSVTASFVAAGALAFNSIVHAATLQPGPVSPGEQLVIFGSGIGPNPGVSFTAVDGASLPTILGGTRVLFDGAPAPLLAAAAGQVTVLVPSTIAGHRTTSVQLEVNNRRSGTSLLGVPDTRPGLFTADGSGRGPAKAFNEDGSPNSAASPASGGSVISLLATGAGLTDATGAPVLPVRVQIAGQDAELVYSGPADGQPGVLRIGARISDGAPSGVTPVRIYCGYTSSPAGTTISVQ